MNRLLLLFLLSLFMLFFSESSSSTDFGTISVSGAASANATVSRGSVLSLVAKSPSGSGHSVLGEFQILIRKKPYMIQAGRTVTASGIIGVAAKLAKALGPIGLAATLAPMIWDPIEGLWKKLEETGQYLDGKWCIGGGVYKVCASQPDSACDAYRSNLGQESCGLTGAGPSQYSCCYSYGNTHCASKLCDTSVSLQLSCPEGTKWNSATATCVEYVYVPASDSDIINKITNNVNESPASALAQGEKNKEHDEPGFTKSMGPIDSVSGPDQSDPITSEDVAVSTKEIPDSDGDGLPELQTTTVTTTTTTYYQYTYTTNSVHITEHTTQTVHTVVTITYSTTGNTTVVNEGNEETETTEGGNEPITPPPVEPGEGEVNPGDDWPSFCSWASVVCLFIDWVKKSPDLPSPSSLPVEDLSPSSQSWVLDLGGASCPADVDVSLPFGRHLTYSYSLLCSTLTTYVYPIVLLMSSILSIYILSGVRVD